jgi:hypothetical protein
MELANLATCQRGKKRKNNNSIFWQPSRRDCSIMPKKSLNLEI